MKRSIVPFALAAALAGCSSSDDVFEPNIKPSFISGDIREASYDGASDDLLTGGLGKTGIAAAAPAFANPAAPTVAELRRNAIHTNYRAVMDYTAAGGYGRLYGPNIDVDGNDTLGEGKVAGTEHIAVADDGSGHQNVVLMVQVPAKFDLNNPCIVTGTSSGSRGVYGAIGTSGEWGLKRGCAVAYSDKGTGNGLHDLMTDSVHRIDGQFTTAAAAGNQAHFRADLTDADRATFNAATPNRVAYKHAHSQQNPEKDWGTNTLQAVKFAFYVLNQKYGDPIDGGPLRSVRLRPSNTLVIASSISNGGGAALAAAEQDAEGLIDGVAVTEPNAQPNSVAGLTVRQGAATVPTIGKPLADYFSYANIYQPCAALSSQAGLSLAAAFWPAAFTVAAQNRCAALAARGLVGGATLAEQADSALAKLHAYGWQAENNFLQQSHFRFATNSIVMTYVNAHGRFSVTENVCGFSFANTDATGNVVPATSCRRQRRCRRACSPPATACRPLRASTSSTTPRSAARSSTSSPSRRPAARPTSRSTARCACGHWSQARTRSRASAWTSLPTSDPVRCATGSRRSRRPRLLRHQPDARGRLVETEVHRGHQRAALRRLHRLRRAARLRQPLRAAARLLRARDGRDVEPPEERRRAAGEPGGADHTARRRRAGAAGVERAGLGNHARRRRRDRLLGHDAHRATVTVRRRRRPAE